jgi:hypothetical protein
MFYKFFFKLYVKYVYISFSLAYFIFNFFKEDQIMVMQPKRKYKQTPPDNIFNDFYTSDFYRTVKSLSSDIYWSIALSFATKIEPPKTNFKITGVSVRGSSSEVLQKYWIRYKELGYKRPDVKFFLPEDVPPFPEQPWRDFRDEYGSPRKNGPPDKISYPEGGFENHPRKPDWKAYYECCHKTPPGKRPYWYWNEDNTPEWPLNAADPDVQAFMKELDWDAQPWTLAERFPELKGVYGGWFDDYRGRRVPLVYGYNTPFPIPDRGPFEACDASPFGVHRPFSNFLGGCRDQAYRLEMMVWLSYTHRDYHYIPLMQGTHLDVMIALTQMNIGPLLQAKSRPFPVRLDKFEFTQEHWLTFIGRSPKPISRSKEAWYYEDFLPNYLNPPKKTDWELWQDYLWNIWTEVGPSLPGAITVAYIASFFVITGIVIYVEHQKKTNNLPDFDLNSWGKDFDKAYEKFAEQEKKEWEEKKRLWIIHKQELAQKEKEQLEQHKKAGSWFSNDSNDAFGDM